MCERSPLSQPGLSSRVSCTTWASVSLRACHGVPSQLECVFPFRARSSSVFALVCSSGAARNELLVPVANTIVLSKSYPLSRRGPIHTQSTPPSPPPKIYIWFPLPSHSPCSEGSPFLCIALPVEKKIHKELGREGKNFINSHHRLSSHMA